MKDETNRKRTAMSTNFDVIHAFITLSPRDVKAHTLRYDSYWKSIFSYDYEIGYWIYVSDKTLYAVIRAHDTHSRVIAKHINILNIRSRCIRSMTLPILTPKLFEKLPTYRDAQGWDFSYFALYRTYAAKAARTKQKVYFEHWKQQMAAIIENLDKIARVFGCSYDRSIYTPEFALQDDQKLLEQFALRDMGVWG